MNFQLWKKAAAALVCALLLWTSEAQAAKQIGEIVSSKPGETIPAVSPQGMGSLGSPAALPTLAPLADNPANLVPVPGLASESVPFPQPQPEVTAAQASAADSALPAPFVGLAPERIEGHAVTATQPATTNPQPTRRWLQFRLSSLFKLTLITAMLLGLHQSYLHDAKPLEEPIRWKQIIGPVLQDLTFELNSPDSPERSRRSQYELFLRQVDEIDTSIFYRAMHGGIRDDIGFNPSFLLKQWGGPPLDEELKEMLRNRPPPWSKEELHELFSKYVDQIKESEYEYSRLTGIDLAGRYTRQYRYLQFAGQVQEFSLKARQHSQRSIDTSQIYLDFLTEVRPLDPELSTPSDQENLQKFSIRARQILDAVNSLDAKQRWLNIKHGIFAAVAAVIAVTPLGRLSRGVKFVFSRVKKSATRSESTPLMGAALFALPGPGALLGAINGWAAAGITLVAAVLTALSFLAWRRRVKPQFSLLGLLKMVAVIAMILGLYRSYTLDAADAHKIWRHKEKVDHFDYLSPKDLVAANNSRWISDNFRYSMEEMHISIHGYQVAREGIFDVLYSRTLDWIATNFIFENPNRLAENDLPGLYQEYVKKFKTHNLGPWQPMYYEEFRLFAEEERFYLKIRSHPELAQDTRALYKEYLNSVLAKHSPWSAADLKRLNERTDAVFDASYFPNTKGVYLKYGVLGGLALAITGLLFWPRRKS